MLTFASAAQPPLTNLFISLAFGAGQVIIGTAMILFTTRKRRWQQLTFFGLALIGAWFACSGITELIVSGAELLSRTGNTFSAASAAHIRAQADQAFLIASIILLATGAGYLLLAWRWTRQQSPTNTDAPSDAAGKQGEEPQTAEAEP